MGSRGEVPIGGPAETAAVCRHCLQILTAETIRIRNCGINPFNASCFKLLLFEGFSAILVKATIFNFDIRALWRSVLSASAPECQKLKTVG